ncbi:hypothetical protein M409DRAFT_50877 [Zasmidium cellare ATCC 36951]|uniref:Rhodopsin domain-containing protein n=1 Tax=Zasmidium cellare ATCC 36951 TaxID=1080233 RepID=A0A6A6D034_ZASCE|nr:uncharacterized protein M409DRAFT_50877 [Zasmidium cellare ATCC 36951]KAF2171439.1 hypothetical protein M409DRAFT_50877 [Zasmidium cellare ATCC 36951]
MASTSLTIPITPPGQHPPLAVVTPTDHSAWIIIAAALGTSLSVLFLGIRVFIRSSGGSRHGLDDWLTAAATAVSVVQSGLVLAACHAGLGKSASLLTAEEIVSTQKIYYAGNLTYVIGLVTSRTIVACFILRLTPIKAHTLYLKSTLAALSVWGVMFVFGLALQCDPSHPWLLRGRQCSGYFVLWVVFESIGCLYEAAVVAMSLWLVWSLKTTFSNKITVIITFGARLILLAIVALRLKSFSRSGQTDDPTLLEAQFIVWSSTELNYSIIAATFPIMRPFINNLATNYGGQGSVDSYHSSRAPSRIPESELRLDHDKAERRGFDRRSSSLRESSSSLKTSVGEQLLGGGLQPDNESERFEGNSRRYQQH